MSVFVPNAVVSVFKDGNPANQSTDDYGQTYDNASPSVTAADATELSAYIAQFDQRTYDPGSGQVTVLTKYKIKLRPSAFDFSEADRLRDERTGLMYQVDSVAQDAGIVQRSDIRLVCKRIT